MVFEVKFAPEAWPFLHHVSTALRSIAQSLSIIAGQSASDAQAAALQQTTADLKASQEKLQAAVEANQIL